MTQGRVCPSLDNDFYVVAAPLSEGKEIEEGIPTEEELPKVRRGERLMQRLSYPTETDLSNKITRNRLVLSFIDSPRKQLGRRPDHAVLMVF